MNKGKYKPRLAETEETKENSLAEIFAKARKRIKKEKEDLLRKNEKN